ncbi:MAG: putative motility protein [Anaerolineales bacterium]
MGIDSISFESQLAQMAIENQSANIGLQISVAVLKSLQEQQNNQAQALLKMIQQSSSLDPAIGKFVNFSV